MATMFGAGQPAATLPSLNDGEVQALPFCIAAEHWSAGQMGNTVLYRVAREHDGGRDRMKVGYFVYWSTERPWGNNANSLSIMQSLLTDAVYSHLFFVLPGVQRALYGAGDIEGVRVTYERGQGGWVPVAAVADDAAHREVALDIKDFRDGQGRVMFKSDVWSHQLGGPDAVQAAQRGASVSCFSGESLVPLTDEVARAFRLGSAEEPLRARPAWRF